MKDIYPLVSIVTVSYNAVSTIEQTILSVINQTYSNIEYIIIDGGSTDGTVDVIKKYQDKVAFWVSEPDKGIYDAMNKGVKVAAGDWINFMNAGDTFVTSTIISDIFSEKCSSDVIYGNSIYCYEGGTISVTAKNINYLSQGMIFCHQSSFVTTNLLKLHLFDSKYKFAADYDFFWKIYKLGNKFEYRQREIAMYSLEGGATDTNYINCFREINLINGNQKNYRYNITIIWLFFREKLLKVISAKYLYRIRKYRYRNKPVSSV